MKKFIKLRSKLLNNLKNMEKYLNTVLRSMGMENKQGVVL